MTRCKALGYSAILFLILGQLCSTNAGWTSSVKSLKKKGGERMLLSSYKDTYIRA